MEAYIMMLITYLALLILIILFMLRKEGYEHIISRIITFKKVTLTPLAIMKALVNSSSLMLKSKAFVLLMLAIFISVLSSGIIASESYSVKELELKNFLQRRGLFIEYDKYISKDAIYEVISRYKVMNIWSTKIPIKAYIDGHKSLVYVIYIDCKLLSLLNLSTKPCEVCTTMFSREVRELKLNNISYVIQYLDLTNYDKILVGDEGLFPILSYVGSHPVKPSLKSIILVPRNVFNEIKFLVGEENICTKIIALCIDECNVAKLRDDIKHLMNLGDVRKAFILMNTSAILISGTTLPSLRSSLIALLVVAIATLISISTSHALTPRLRTLSEVLLVAGTPAWLVNVSAQLIYLTFIFMSGLVALIIITTFLGSAAGFNGLLTFVLSIASSYLTLRHSLSAVITRLEILPLPRDIIIKSVVPIEEIIDRIKKAFESDEVFDVLEFKYIKSNEVHLLRLDLLYKQAISIGLGLEVALEPHKEGVRMFISPRPWSIEDIGEKYLYSISRLAVSKVIGVLQLCQLR